MILRIESAEKGRDFADEIHREETGRGRCCGWKPQGRDFADKIRREETGREGVDKGERMEAAERGAGRGRCYGLLMQLRAHEVQVAEVVEAEGATFGGLYT